jgi:hypothetical protein
MGGGASKIAAIPSHARDRDIEHRVQRAVAAMWDVSIALNPGLSVITEDNWRWAVLACNTTKKENAILQRYLAHSSTSSDA